MMSESHSVSELLKQLEDGESEAARQLWNRYFPRLLAAARKHLQNLPRLAMDEEDVALSAFDALAQGVKNQQYKQMENRDDLKQVLFMLVKRKAIKILRREFAEKNGGGQIRGESVFEDLPASSSAAGGIDQVGDPNPLVVEDLTLGVREMLDGLEDELLQKIAIAKLEGHTNKAIAEKQGITLRAVERKLRLIRRKWEAYRPD